MKFNHLNVPDQWQHYWSKYPNGYTILEALLNWVAQVDSMVDNVNEWNLRLDEFIQTFDTELQEKVNTTLNIWEIDGTLDNIINYKLMDLKATKTEVESGLSLKRDKASKIVLSDLAGEVIAALSGTSTFDLLSVPQDGSVNPLKMDAATFSQLYTTSTKNLYNGYKAKSGFVDCLNVLTASAGHTYSEKIPVTTGVYYFSDNGLPTNARFVTPLRSDGTSAASSSSQYQNIPKFTVTNDITHLIVTFTLSGTNKFGVSRSVIASPYEPYYVNKREVIPKMTPKKNLFNKSKATSGNFVNWNDGSLQANADYWLSEMIEVEPNTTYVQNMDTHFAIYGSDFSFVEGHQKGTGFKTFTTPPNARYVVTSLNPISSKETYQLEKGTSSTAYESFSYTMVNASDNTPITITEGAVIESNWAGKNGDSLGDSLTFSNQFQPIVQGKFGLASFANHGVSGSRVSGTGSDSMNNDTRINALSPTADFIVFMGGTNDWANSVPLGTVNSTSQNDFYGAVKIVAEKLITRYPGKRIIFLTTPYGKMPNRVDPTTSQAWPDTTGHKNLLGLTTKEYGNVILEVARMYGIPCVDIYGNAGMTDLNTNYYFNTGDYLHPKLVGQTRFAELIASKLREIEPL
jgi:lysophospholipase L1-like esterase